MKAISAREAKYKGDGKAGASMDRTWRVAWMAKMKTKSREVCK